MTYCVGFLLEAGLVFASDTRTNAGVDYISSYSKMHIFKPAPDRLFVLLTAGNLATAQAVMSRMRRDIEEPQPARSNHEDDPGGPDLLTSNYLFEAVDYVGRLSLRFRSSMPPLSNRSAAVARRVSSSVVRSPDNPTACT
jgi:putative proteasome-type protease